MKYIFCGNFSTDLEADLKNMRVAPPVAGHKFQINLLSGLENNVRDIAIINIPRIRYYPHYKKIFIKKQMFSLENIGCGTNIGFANIPIINYFSKYHSLIKELEVHLKESKDKFITLIFFNNHLPMICALLAMRKKYKNVHICMVIGDLHGKYGLYTTDRYKGIRGKIISQLEKKQDELSRQCDAFGLLTKYMAEALHVENKPHVIIEGIYSEKDKIMISEESENKVVFYAGTINHEYGIMHMLNAFSMIEGEEYRLILAGSGDAVNDVKKRAENDSRINYLGFVTPAEVERQQQRATVLINPRTSDHTFVKYSFPSKNMECLASGKPYIAHDLICNPSEYKDYIQYPADESDEALARKIVEVCELPLEQRLAIGKRAREFILKEKNPQRQCKKIVDMMEQIERDRNKNDKESEI